MEWTGGNGEQTNHIAPNTRFIPHHHNNNNKMSKKCTQIRTTTSTSTTTALWMACTRSAHFCPIYKCILRLAAFSVASFSQRRCWRGWCGVDVTVCGVRSTVILWCKSFLINRVSYPKYIHIVRLIASYNHIRTKMQSTNDELNLNENRSQAALTDKYIVFIRNVNICETKCIT